MQQKLLRVLAATIALLLSLWALTNLIAGFQNADRDGDGLQDSYEEQIGTNPLLADSDGDGINDKEELEFWRDLANSTGLSYCEPFGDCDHDFIDNILDYDSDDDGIPDGKEIEDGTNPADEDTDDDGMSDMLESYCGTNPFNPDTDGDGVCDGMDGTPCGSSGESMSFSGSDPGQESRGIPRYGGGGEVVCHVIFNPALVHAKRITTYDAITNTYEFYIHDPSLTEISTSAQPLEHSFEATITLTHVGDDPIRIPSVAPTAQIVSYSTSPDTPLSFYIDGADNYYVQSSSQQDNIEFTYQMTADASYFTFSIPSDLTLADIPDEEFISLPSYAQTKAAIFIGELGLSGQSNLQIIVDTLYEYFSTFTAGDIPDEDEEPDLYLAIARSHHGKCDVRSFAFFVTANGIGIPTRMVTNECHAFVEIYIPTEGWTRLDLGGLGTCSCENPDDNPLFVEDETPPGYGGTGEGDDDSSQDPEDDEQNPGFSGLGDQGPGFVEGAGDGYGYCSGYGDGACSGGSGGLGWPFGNQSGNFSQDGNFSEGSGDLHPWDTPSDRLPTVTRITYLDTSSFKDGIFITEGYVQDTEGNGIENIAVGVFLTPEKEIKGLLCGWLRTDDNGSYQITGIVPEDIPVGENHVVAISLGNKTYKPSWTDPIIEIYSNTTLRFTMLSSVGMSAVFNITGELIDDGGIPVAGQTIQLYLDDGFFKNVVTNDEGKFDTSHQFSILDEHDFRAVFPGDTYLYGSESTHHLTVRDMSTNIVLTAQPEQLLRGEVLDVGGMLVSGSGYPIVDAELLLSFDTLEETIPTNDDGTFYHTLTVPQLSQLGNITLSVYYPGTIFYAEASAEQIILVQSETTLVLLSPTQQQIHQNETISIIALLTDDAETPLTNSKIFLHWKKTYNSSIFISDPVTDENGTINITFQIPVDAPLGSSMFGANFAGTDVYRPSFAFQEFEIIAQEPSDSSQITNMLLAFAVGGVIVLVVVFIMLFKKQKEEEPQHIETIARNTIQQLETQQDPRMSVLNCYKQMCQWLGQQGIPNGHQQTPRELAQSAKRFLNVAPNRLYDLTKVFEKARYSTHSINEEDQQTAISCLQAIISASVNHPQPEGSNV